MTVYQIPFQEPFILNSSSLESTNTQNLLEKDSGMEGSKRHYTKVLL